ncbi:MAG TPA: glycosyltransferase [Pyrinomonadaceae bacterium]|nr:glycosyltransferase [Pyrinomonadaceae bacterium]
MEQLSIYSFLHHGHEYHLYTYDNVKYVPAGTVVKDANEILPASSIFQYKHRPSYAGFANHFRYKLLFERGGWWVDTDTVCLKPFDFSEPYVFSSEINTWGFEVINNGMIKAPAGSSIMAHVVEVCERKDPARLVWGETGPKLLGNAVKSFSLRKYKQPHYTFCPIDYPDWHYVLDAKADIVLNEKTYAIHLWNEMWRTAGQDKNARYDNACLYEQLKRTYLPVNEVAQLQTPIARVAPKTVNGMTTLRR